MSNSHESNGRSTILPTDPFEIALAEKLGLPNGAHTAPAVVQAVDFYGNTARFIVQTVKWDEGLSVFITEVKGDGRGVNLMLPPKVTALLQRRADSVTTIVRRRAGRRLAEQLKAEGRAPVFTPEMRRKALVTRKRKAAARAARKAARS